MEVSTNGVSPKWIVYGGKSIKQNPIYLRGFRSHGATPLSLDGLSGKILVTWMKTRATSMT